MREEVVEGAIDGARWDIARGGGGRSEGGSEGAWDRDTMLNVDVGSRADRGQVRLEVARG